jgi:selenium-binding protein 1
MPETTDPTFYRSPGAAIAAPGEKLAYVAAFDPQGVKRDAMAVVDCDASSSSYGQVVGWSELPTAGNELHHFGWNACSSALCHEGHGHNGSLERRYLVVPGIRSSRTYILDTKPDPRQPKVVRTIEPEELASKAGYSRPHTVHCGPGGIFMSNLGSTKDGDGPGGVALIDHDTFEVIGAWEKDRGDQFLAYDVWWHLNDDVAITSEWATPAMIENGLNPEDLLGKRFGHHLDFWSLSEGRLIQRIDLGDEHQMVLELRPAHNPQRRWGFVGVGISPRRYGCGTGRATGGRSRRSSRSRPSAPRNPSCHPLFSRLAPCLRSSQTSTSPSTTAGCTSPAGGRASSSSTTCPIPTTPKRPARCAWAGSPGGLPTQRPRSWRWPAGRRWSR